MSCKANNYQYSIYEITMYKRDELARFDSIAVPSIEFNHKTSNVFLYIFMRMI